MKLREIERLRGAAVLMVVVHHLARVAPWPGLAWLRDAGWTGVDLFFVVSGFVVTGSLLRALPAVASPRVRERIVAAGPVLKAFYARRVWRILPLAWAWGGLAVLLAGWRGGAFGEVPGVLRELLAVVTFHYNYFAIGVRGERLAWFWSLAVEEHFYFLLPLALVLVASARGRLVAALAGLLVVVLVLRPLVVPDALLPAWEAFRYPSHLRFDGLLVGVLLALLRARGLGARWSWRPSPILSGVLSLALVVGVAGFPLVVPFGAMLGVGSTLVALVAAVLVFLAGLDRGLVLDISGLTAPLEWLGSRSYALYLVHPLALRLVLEAGALTPASVVAFVAVTLVWVEASHRWIERPGIAFGARLRGVRPSAASLETPLA
jgi:peptidoglycan/LPS O-acetylase OafA/YrhL